MTETHLESPALTAGAMATLFLHRGDNVTTHLKQTLTRQQFNIGRSSVLSYISRLFG